MNMESVLVLSLTCNKKYTFEQISIQFNCLRINKSVNVKESKCIFLNFNSISLSVVPLCTVLFVSFYPANVTSILLFYQA